MGTDIGGGVGGKIKTDIEIGTEIGIETDMHIGTGISVGTNTHIETDIHIGTSTGTPQQGSAVGSKRRDKQWIARIKKQEVRTKKEGSSQEEVEHGKQIAKDWRT